MKNTIPLLVLNLMICSFAFAQDYSVLWEKTIGTSTNDRLHDVVVLSDNSLVFVGTTYHTDTSGYYDFYIVKTDMQGEVDWEVTFGGNDFDFPDAVIETYDNGILVGGSTRSTDGDVSNSIGSSDFWIIKINSNGELMWEKTYGGDRYENLRSMTKNKDGYILVGESGSNNRDASSNAGRKDAWVVQINKIGNIIWEKSYGGSEDDGFNSVLVTSEGNLLFSGTTESSDGLISNHLGGIDIWVVLTDSTGNLIWEKTFGGSKTDYAAPNSLHEFNDNQYIICGSTFSSDYDLDQNLGHNDALVIKFYNTGKTIWSYSYGYQYGDYFSDVQKINNSSILLFGSSTPIHGTIANYEYWLVTLNTDDGTILKEQMFEGGTDDHSVKMINTPNNNLLLTGSSSSLKVENDSTFYDKDILILALEEIPSDNSDLTCEAIVSYPNPSTGTLFIQDFSYQYLDVEVYDITGKKLISERVFENKIDLDMLIPGMYLLTLQNEDCTEIKRNRIIIQN